MCKMKKILVVSAGTGIGGIEKCMINFLRYLETYDCDIDLALWREGPLFSQIPSGVNYLGCLGPGNLKSIFRLLKKGKVLSFFKSLFYYSKYKILSCLDIKWKAVPNLMEEYDIAISYSHGGNSPYYVIDKVEAKEKYLWYHELNYIGNENTKTRDLKYFKKYTKIICVSDACRLNLANCFPSIVDKFITLYNFYNIKEIKEKSTLIDNPYNTTKKVIATVGRLSKEKGVELAINTCRELLKIRNDFIWYWIGDGPEYNSAKELLKKYSIESNFILLGNKLNPYPYIKNCDLYVQPSLSEAYCTTVIEAKILNKPIVMTDVSSAYEQLNQTEFSRIVPKNSSELSNSIDKILSKGSSIVCDYSFIDDTYKYDKLFGLRK